jgi:hypothetical protein
MQMVAERGNRQPGEARPVQVLDAEGRLLFDDLLDDGTLVLSFARGFGFVDALDVALYGWQIIEARA